MKRYIRNAMLAALVSSIFSLSLLPVHTMLAASDRTKAVNPIQQLSQSQENLAYSLGIQAYLYGYPLVVVAKTMGDMTRSLAPLN